MGVTMRRWRKDGAILLYITLPFALVAGALLIIAEQSGGGWSALGYVVYAMGVGALWAVVVVGYLVWVVIRDGWQPSSIPAIVVLGMLLLVGAGWAHQEYAEVADCRADRTFYRALASMPGAERAAAIRDGGRSVREPSECAIDELMAAFGRTNPYGDPPLPDLERWAALEQLLEAGLPPTRWLLYGFAVSDADPMASRLLLRRLRVRNAEGGATPERVSDYLVQALIDGVRQADDEAEAQRYRTVLQVLIEEGLPEPPLLSEEGRKKLAEAGVSP